MMGKLKKLISKLCPNGVPYLTLAEIGTFTRGKRFVHADAVEKGIPCIHYGELYTYYGIYTYTTKSFVRTDLAHDLRFAHKNDVIIVGAGENDIDIGIAVAYLGDDSVAVHDACYIFTHKCNPKYISYCLRTNDYHNQIKKYVSSGKICAISAEGLGKAMIPVPPIEIQDEIVKYLDEFSGLTTELISIINTELEGRTKQYEYYREALITGGNEVELSSVAYYSKDRIAVSSLSSETYISVENMLPNKAGKREAVRIPSEGNATKYVAGDILIGNIRPYLRKIWKADSEGGTNGDVLVVRSADPSVLLPDYLYYVLSSEDFFEYDTKKSKGSKMPRGDKSAVMKYTFSLPTVTEQHAIVAILDKYSQCYFELADNLSSEVKARRLQYEYYRDELLTFKKI